MTDNVRRFVALALFVASLTGAAMAQSFSHVVRANVPFEFYAGSTLLPPGTYTFSLETQGGVLLIADERKGDGLFLGSPDEGSSNGIPTLTFHINNEGTYVLQKVREWGYGVSFNNSKKLLGVASDRRADSERTLVAELLK